MCFVLFISTIEIMIVDIINEIIIRIIYVIIINMNEIICIISFIKCETFITI